MNERIPYWAYIDAAARAFAIGTDEILGAKRYQQIVLARHVAAHLLRKHCAHMSTTEIGRRLGGKDHTSIMHACRNIDRLLADDWLADRYAAAERDALSWTRSTPRAATSNRARYWTGSDIKSLSAAKFEASRANSKTDRFWDADGEPEEMKAMRREAAERQKAFVAGIRLERVA